MLYLRQNDREYFQKLAKDFDVSIASLMSKVRLITELNADKLFRVEQGEGNADESSVTKEVYQKQ